MEKLILKFIKNHKRPRVVKMIFKNKWKLEDLDLTISNSVSSYSNQYSYQYG